MKMPLFDLLEVAAQSGVLIEEGTGAHITYHFRHPLLAGFLNNQLSSTRRARLHRRAADALQQVYATNEGAQAASITRHLVEGGAGEAQITPYATSPGITPICCLRIPKRSGITAWRSNGGETPRDTTIWGAGTPAPGFHAGTHGRVREDTRKLQGGAPHLFAERVLERLALRYARSIPRKRHNRRRKYRRSCTVRLVGPGASQARLNARASLRACGARYYRNVRMLKVLAWAQIAFPAE